jgi:dTDP-4-amino-4,6-dideoxygalactose transaminase
MLDASGQEPKNRFFSPSGCNAHVHVPLLDLNAQLDRIKDDLHAAVTEVVDSCRYIMGPKVTGLEEAIAEYTGTRAGIGVSSGTDALLVALMGLEIGTGDLVITSPYSFFATAGAVSRLGAIPVFVDIDPDSYNLSPQRLSEWFEAHPADAERVKAIIPVHLYGQSADMDPILEIARSRNIAVIEDAAQAVGARHEGAGGLVRAGSMGDVGCFSFFPSKNLGGMGDGGMVVTNDEALAERIRKLRNHGSHPKYYHELIGGNFRLDAMQAAILLVKLQHLETWHAERQANAANYDELLQAIPQVATPKVAQRREYHIYNQYVIRVDDRDPLREHLAANDIGTEIYYPVPFHRQKCFEYLGYKEGDLPESERAAEHTLALPVYSELTREMQDYIVQSIGEFYG